jgi:translation elongation factor EF-Tu-like GTPase
VNLKWLLVVLLLSGCQNATASKSDVLLLGDDARLSLLSDSRVEAPRKGASASEVANAAAKAKHAVLVIDAANGPLSITREHILIARQARVPSLSMLVVNTAALDALPDKASLIDIEVAEVRQLFDKYEIKGSAVPLFFDESGLKSILRETVALPARAPESTPSPSRKEVSGFIYLLSAPESPGVKAIRHGDTVTIWVGGQTTTARVNSKAAIEPGGMGDIQVETDVPVGFYPGQRFLFESDGKIVAAGVVTK